MGRKSAGKAALFARMPPLAPAAGSLVVVVLPLLACAPAVDVPAKTAARPSANQETTAMGGGVGVGVDEQAGEPRPAVSATSGPSEIEEGSGAALGETEACEAACIAASAERSREIDEEIEEARRRCSKAAPAGRAKCLADVDGHAAERQYEEDGNQHACRTNCPGYLDQF